MKIYNDNCSNSKFIEEELRAYGFKGKSMRDLQAIILSKEDLEKFQNFIFINEGKYKSKIQLVYNYKNYVKDENGLDLNTFTDLYNKASTKEDKRIVLQKLVKEHVSLEVLEKIEGYLNSGYTIEWFYDNVKKSHEVRYSANGMVNIIDSSTNNNEKIVGVSMEDKSEVFYDKDRIVYARHLNGLLYKA